MKTVTLGLGGSSGRKEREERTHLEVSIKTKVPGWGKYALDRRVKSDTVFYELDWHNTMESIGAIQEIVILEEYEGGKYDV